MMLSFLHKKFFKKYRGATLLELMAMLLVVSLALTTMFVTLTQSIWFARDSEARIKATALAREGIEAITNIRNTNWLRFISDRKNCWNTLNYNSSCIGWGAGVKKIDSGSYILKNKNGLWELDTPTQPWNDTQWSSSFREFRLKIDTNGWYAYSDWQDPADTGLPLCQNIGDNNQEFNCNSIFAREVQITADPSQPNTFIAKAIVHWNNGWPRKVEISSVLTNWKANYDNINP